MGAGWGRGGVGCMQMVYKAAASMAHHDCCLLLVDSSGISHAASSSLHMAELLLPALSSRLFSRMMDSASRPVISIRYLAQLQAGGWGWAGVGSWGRGAG